MMNSETISELLSVLGIEVDISDVTLSDIKKHLEDRLFQYILIKVEIKI